MSDIDEIVTCECCKEDIEQNYNMGCCKDGDCPHKVEVMCRDCGTWDEEEEVWICADCVDVKQDCDKCGTPTDEHRIYTLPCGIWCKACLDDHNACKCEPCKKEYGHEDDCEDCAEN